MSRSPPTVFISYAREDLGAVRRLYNDLKRAGANPWLDIESLLPGQRWKVEIRRAIRESRYFLAVLSSNSVSRRGYVHKEVAEALEILDEFPESEIFMIPVRLDNCSPSHERLRDLQWVDMFPSWDNGVEKILRAIGVQLRGNGIPWDRTGIIAAVIVVLTALGIWLGPGVVDVLPKWLSNTSTAPLTRIPTTIAAVTKPPMDTPTVTPASSPMQMPFTSTATPTNTPFTFTATPTFIPTPTPTSVVPPTDTPTPVPPTPTPVPPTAIPIVPTPMPHLIGKIAYVMSDGIYVMDADGSNGGIVYEGSVRMSALSPDGNKIGFSRKDGLWVMNVDGSGVQQIVSSDGISSLAWSPDSKQIVYSQGKGPAGEGYIVEIPHGIPQPLGGWIYDPDWSPDGWLVYYTFQGMVKRQVSGGPISVLDSNVDWLEGQPAWSPDGTRIVYSEGADILVINTDGSGQTKLTDDPGNDWDPCWSPDGSKIAFITDRDGNSEIYVMNPDGSNQMNLTNSAENEWQPTWAP